MVKGVLLVTLFAMIMRLELWISGTAGDRRKLYLETNAQNIRVVRLTLSKRSYIATLRGRSTQYCDAEITLPGKG